MINLVKKIHSNTSYFYLRVKVNTFELYFFTNDVLDYCGCDSIGHNLFYGD